MVAGPEPLTSVSVRLSGSTDPLAHLETRRNAWTSESDVTPEQEPLRVHRRHGVTGVSIARE
jgi:hypothetical protein